MTRPDLKCFRELRVSDPRLLPDASASTYAFVDRAGRRHEVELRYKYDAPLYGALSEVMRNQARIHHSIASLNYGLFADCVVLEFPVTEADLAYYRRMQAVTAREQYLTRFVGATPHELILPEYHVTPEAFEPPAVDDVAEVVVESVVEEPAPGPSGAGLPARDPARYAVLSSGGKESLLTYGLLREMGRDVAPVYVNESGRHWHTALLAYRLHERTEARTRRIWTTVDRLYVFANRLLPFVHPRWQRMEADVYPTQLFTFNSYQMGVAGLCLHEGRGTMLMGNEFDEGPWPSVKGVTYWYGIYDQSQEFDLVLNAYFARKGWGLVQTSLLRTLSGILIEDLLATRYPDLLEVQTSCHATHLDAAGRPAPCGRCSKCLGILLFLLAGGHDPRRLRYDPKDVEALPARVQATAIKIDRPESEHAMWLAARRGTFAFQGSGIGHEPREHPEVEALRFHPETSRRDAMPPELAKECYEILLARAKGVLERAEDGTWRASAV